MEEKTELNELDELDPELESPDELEMSDENDPLGLDEEMLDAASESAREETPVAKPTPSKALGEKAFAMTSDIPIQVVAVLGKKTMTLDELLRVEMGQILQLGRPVTTSVDLVANGKLVAKGELVEVDGAMGVKVVKLIK